MVEALSLQRFVAFFVATGLIVAASLGGESELISSEFCDQARNAREQVCKVDLKG